MKEIISVNFEEIYLKGQNQKFFADVLRDQLKTKLKAFGPKLHFAHRHGGSIFIEVNENLEPDEWESIKKIISQTPGVTGFYKAVQIPVDKDEIIETALRLAEEKILKAKSFRVTAKRLDKTASFTSRELAADVGAAIVQKFGTKVDLTRPDYTIYIKVRKDGALIYDEMIPGIGGLPVGTSGKAVALLSGGIDSPVAAFMAMTRGLEVTAVHFHSVPKTSPQSIEKVKALAKKLTAFQPKLKLYIIPVLPIQQAIARHTDSKLRLILLRRFMYMLATKIAEQESAKALITGDSLGQVASQTLENLMAISEVTGLFLFRPLIALDKKYIIEKAREIGTYDISIQPHDDACALFTPKRPETKAKPDYVRKEWNRLDVEQLLKQAMQSVKIFEIQ